MEEGQVDADLQYPEEVQDGTATSNTVRCITQQLL
jgi:hypothetical protein